jgi:septum formation protein
MTPLIKPLILASSSAGRQEMLEKAGLAFEAIAARIDEDTLREALVADSAKPRDIADCLAEAKALKISRKFPKAMVIGSDQILVTENGELLNKADTPEQAEVTIAKLAGKSHRLISAIVVCEEGKPVWRIIDSARLMMKPMAAQEVIAYVARHWDVIRYCVGCYRIEAEGADLFSDVEGRPSTIIGMPIEPLLDYLTLRGYERQI